MKSSTKSASSTKSSMKSLVSLAAIAALTTGCFSAVQTYVVPTDVEVLPADQQPSTITRKASNAVSFNTAFDLPGTQRQFLLKCPDGSIHSTHVVSSSLPTVNSWGAGLLLGSGIASLAGFFDETQYAHIRNLELTVGIVQLTMATAMVLTGWQPSQGQLTEGDSVCSTSQLVTPAPAPAPAEVSQ